MIIQEELTKKDGTKFNASRNRVAEKKWRLVYNNGEIKDLFESGGYTWTINNLFCGSEKKCLDEIDRLHLKHKDTDAKIR
jgi:hypothetical protein